MKHAHRQLGIVSNSYPDAAIDLHRRVRDSIAQTGTRATLVAHEASDFSFRSTAGQKRNRAKLDAFNEIRRFERRHVTTVLLPDFASHLFMQELQTHMHLQLVSMLDALLARLSRMQSDGLTIGILASTQTQSSRLFESAFDCTGHAMIYPATAIQREMIEPVAHAHNDAADAKQAIPSLRYACQHLLDRGADIIIAGSAPIAMHATTLGELSFPVVDTYKEYAQFALTGPNVPRRDPFRVGVVGGVGPAATVDFLNKIVSNTNARHDQDHIKLIIEHNPQIPDRTAYLTAQGTDPTLALYATCRRLQAAGADMIVIPCNTAHALLGDIQPYLHVPIINMLEQTVEHIDNHGDNLRTVGLLATTGTISSGIYHAAARNADFRLIVPAPNQQKGVMRAIYGPQGIKAGYTTGQCTRDIMQAAESLVQKGAQALILGCTELPLVLPATSTCLLADQQVAIIDPTEILAHVCIHTAKTAGTCIPNCSN